MHQLVKDALGFDSKDARASQRKHLQPGRKRLWRVIIAVVVVVMVGISLFVDNWPFRRRNVITNLEEAMQGKVSIGKFHRTYFPPGCVAEDVTFTQYGNLRNAVPITVRNIRIRGSFRGMLTSHVPVLYAQGVHLVAASANALAGWGRNGGESNKSKTIVDEFIITDSVLEFSSPNKPSPVAGKKAPTAEQASALRFEIARLTIRNSGPNAPLRFETTLLNPMPPGQLRLTGALGPWRSGAASETPLSGAYIFEQANLGAFHGIAGTLSSNGSFSGTVQQLEIRGKTETPDFEVTDTGHKMPLDTEFQARINTKNGDLTLEKVTARLGKSSIGVDGVIAESTGEKGKTTSLDMTVYSGRIQDFLFLFLDDRVAAMNGAFSFKGKIRLPPGHEAFLKRVELQGDFGIGDARLGNPKKQSELEDLSERAEGEKDDPPERVVSDLKGHVVVRGGTATFLNASFRVPGAVAHLHGTYSLISYRIDLHGRLLTEATLPKATSGVKSFLLKIISPLLKKNHRGGGVVALSITGVYPQPVYNTTPVTNP